MKRTLYISDLDGTLLNSQVEISSYSADVINRLVREQGLIFSYATARSPVTAFPVTKNLSTNIPAVVYNGAFIVQNNKYITENYFDPSEIEFIKELTVKQGVFPIVYSMQSKCEKYSFLTSYKSRAQDDFIASRNDYRKTPVNSVDDLYSGQVFHFSFIGEEDRLSEIHKMLRDRCVCYFHRDIYSGEMWLELTRQGVTKASSALKLKKLLGCDELVAFGDAINDLPLFEAADRCYAVENACNEIKSAATGIIKSNDDNGVAKFLESIF